MAAKNKQEKKQEMTLAQRGQAAVAKFLENRGYEIIEADPERAEATFPIVAKDMADLVFCGVTVRGPEAKSLPTMQEEAEMRSTFEEEAARWLGEHRDKVEENISIRFDLFAMIVVGPDRALLRHHVNAFGIG